MDKQSRHRGTPWIIGIAALGAVGWALTRGAAGSGEEAADLPRDTPKPLAEDVWIVDAGPIRAGGMTMPIRMTVVRLADGALLLHSPTPYVPWLAEALAAIGPVRHLVAPNVAHWLYAADWQHAFPDAIVWAVPALGDRAQVRASGLRIDAALGEAPPASWPAEIVAGMVRGGAGFEEAWLFHQPSRTLILADLIQNLRAAKLPPLTAAAMRVAGATRGTTARHVRAAVRLGGAPARAAVAALVATEPQAVVFAHGEPFTQDAAGRLRRAFRWLLG